MSSAADQRPRVDAARVADLLGDVRRGLEAHERVVGDDRGRERGERRVGARRELARRARRRRRRRPASRATATMTISRPVSSITVITTLPAIDSRMPRALSAATSSRKTIATRDRRQVDEAREVVAGEREREPRRADDARGEHAEARPGTTRSGCGTRAAANTAAPPARGYFVTSSAYEPAVSSASRSASSSGSHSTPPTSADISPVSA